MTFQTIRVRVEPPVCTLRLHRPAAANSINGTMVDECRQVLDLHGGSDAVHIVVVEGLPEAFCTGADFQDHAGGSPQDVVDPEALYDLWHQLAGGPFISIAHVRGTVAAGGVGFAAACDMVLADRSAQFSLSELLFGLFPACVLPFLTRRIGVQRAHYMTLTTLPVTVQQALDWGLVDAADDDSDDLLRRHVLRLRRLSKAGIRRYKTHVDSVTPVLAQARAAAIAANRALFSDPEILAAITRFSRTGLFPWEN